MRTIAAARFKAECLKIIDEMNRDGEAATITRRGQPVATLVPYAPPEPVSIFGALKGGVLHYDDPFGSAEPPQA